MSILQITEMAGSALRVRTRRRAYTPFGYDISGPAFIGFRSMPGEAHHACYLAGNGRRAFLPALMRFTAADTLSPFAAGGLNAYSYCAAEPVNRLDPSGGWWETLKVFLSLETLQKQIKPFTGPNRHFLGEVLQEFPGRQPFIEGSAAVNGILMALRRSDISSFKMEHYLTLSTKVYAGEISNTTAFFSSSGGWVRDVTSQPLDRITGGVLNAASAIVIGGIEKTTYSSGRLFKPI